MLKIGEFSKLSHLTVKALRFYEQEGILIPASTDEWTGYRYYEGTQLTLAARIKRLRQLDLSIEEIKSICGGADVKEILIAKSKSLENEKARIDTIISTINHILEVGEMSYQVKEKIIPEVLVYSSETVLGKYADMMQWIPSVGQECMELNPDIECAEPAYEFCEYLDGEYKDRDIWIRHSEAVTGRGKENEHIKFRVLPETRVLSVDHHGAYDNIGETYAFIINYAKEHEYEIAGIPRECYIDGVWNKDSVDEWLTEIQLPVK